MARKKVVGRLNGRSAQGSVLSRALAGRGVRPGDVVRADVVVEVYPGGTTYFCGTNRMQNLQITNRVSSDRTGILRSLLGGLGWEMWGEDNPVAMQGVEFVPYNRYALYKLRNIRIEVVPRGRPMSDVQITLVADAGTKIARIPE